MFPKNFIVSSIILFLGLLAFDRAEAVPKEGESLNKIVAVVGDQIITASEIQGELYNLAQTQPGVDMDDPELRDKILELLINQKLKIQKAIKDSVEVSEEEVDMRWNQALMSMKQRYGSERRIEEIYGKSISSLRYEYRDQIKNALLAEKLTQLRMTEVDISPVEVKEFYEEFSDSLQTVPDKPVVRHIVKYLVPDEETKDNAERLALRIRDSIIAGAEFAAMAEMHSQDPGTRMAGGDLGWTKRGSLVPEYEKAAFALQPGELSLPVESPFGFHVIRVEDKRADEIKTSHILIKIDRSNNSKDETYAFLKSIKDSIAAGASFEELAKRHSEDKSTKGFGGLIELQQASRFSAEARQKMTDMAVGQVSEPIIYAVEPNKPGYHILYKEDIIPAHEPTPETDYALLELMAKNMKRQELMEEWHQELRKEIYWKIVDEE